MRSLLVCAAVAASLSGCTTVANTFGDQPENIGPCPSALALYDAHRVVRFEGEEQIYTNVGFTGEILGVRSLCSYYDDRPIIANLEVDMGFGRGPGASGDTGRYTYFVTITRTDLAVIHKETFPVEVRFDAGEDRVFRTERIDAISIPRANPGTSGANFEILVGFDLTPEELAYNRSGRRFRVTAGQD